MKIALNSLNVKTVLSGGTKMAPVTLGKNQELSSCVKNSTLNAKGEHCLLKPYLRYIVQDGPISSMAARKHRPTCRFLSGKSDKIQACAASLLLTLPSAPCQSCPSPLLPICAEMIPRPFLQIYPNLT